MAIVIIIVCIIAIFVAFSMYQDNQRGEMAEIAVSQITDFSESKSFKSTDNKTYFGIDKANSKIMFGRVTTEGLYKKVYENFTVVDTFEDIQNGSTLVVDTENNKIAYGFINPAEEEVPSCSMVENFHCDRCYMHKLGVAILFHHYGNAFYAIDKMQKELLIGNTRYGHHLIPFKNIIKYEIIEDGLKTSEKSLASVIGRSAVGGIVAGNAGAVIGGATTSTKENKKIKEISIKLLLRNEESDSVTVCIYKHSSEKKSNDPEVQSALKSSTKFADALSIIIDEVAQDEKGSNATTSAEKSLTDELSKLVQLKNTGVLTDEEFAAAKGKLLN